MKGFALIEILLTLFILSFALLALAGMQMSALRHSQAAYLRSLALVQLSSLIDRLQVNHPSLHNAELARWNAQNARLLPKAQGSYHCLGVTCAVSLNWQFGQLEQATLSITLRE